MFKKHMTPIGIHKPGTLSNGPGKGATPPPAAMNAARGGGANTMQDYAKATPMAQPQPQPQPQPQAPAGGEDPFGM